MIKIDVSCADGRPVQTLANLVEQRSRWLNETAEQSCAACMIDVLVSLRASTNTAKPKKKEIHIEASSLLPSFTGGRSNPTFCLREGKARYTLRNNERIGFATKDLKNAKIWQWNDDARKCIWYVVAINVKEATNWAFEKIKKRASRQKGLARIALSKLMMLSGSKTSQQMNNQQAAKTASQLVSVTKSANGNYYSLQAYDMLDYAKIALKGGDSSINQAVMKASNKIASVINQKCKNILSFEKIPTPFPDVRT